MEGVRGRSSKGVRALLPSRDIYGPLDVRLRPAGHSSSGPAFTIFRINMQLPTKLSNYASETSSKVIPWPHIQLQTGSPFLSMPTSPSSSNSRNTIAERHYRLPSRRTIPSPYSLFSPLPRPPRTAATTTLPRIPRTPAPNQTHGGPTLTLRAGRENVSTNDERFHPSFPFPRRRGLDILDPHNQSNGTRLLSCVLAPFFNNPNFAYFHPSFTSSSALLDPSPTHTTHTQVSLTSPWSRHHLSHSLTSLVRPKNPHTSTSQQNLFHTFTKRFFCSLSPVAALSIQNLSPLPSHKMFLFSPLLSFPPCSF
ncbi:hypothetical protein V8E36_007143 [Tilletia maclaganii]